MTRTIRHGLAWLIIASSFLVFFWAVSRLITNTKGMAENRRQVYTECMNVPDEAYLGCRAKARDRMNLR